MVTRKRPAPQAAAAQSHFSGFDTGSYPGDGVMRAWFGKPFVFTGFYLEAPFLTALQQIREQEL